MPSAIGTNAHDYLLGRDYVAATRLNLQHYMWIQELGYHLHPKIPALKAGAFVADVATGTGVWAMDLADQMPSVTFLGCDIDLEQSPPPEWLPSNLSLEVLDIFKPPPAHLVGRFHVVHLRLLVCVIRDDPAPVLRNLISLLAPGGYIQWGEVDPATTRFEAARPEVSLTAIERAGTFPATLRGEDSRLHATWVSSLAECFEQGGLRVVADEHAYRRANHLRYYTDYMFMVWQEWRASMGRKDAEKYGALIDDALKARAACQGGLAINMEIRTVVGQKPFDT